MIAKQSEFRLIAKMTSFSSVKLKTNELLTLAKEDPRSKLSLYDKGKKK